MNHEHTCSMINTVYLTSAQNKIERERAIENYAYMVAVRLKGLRHKGISRGVKQEKEEVDLHSIHMQSSSGAIEEDSHPHNTYTGLMIKNEFR